jgi:TP901 family phage tail tape measure protein
VTDALTAFGKTAKDTGNFVDVMAKTASSANTDVSMLGESFKYVAPVAGAMKYSIEDTSLALGLMANAGVKASSAGTSLRSWITRMASPTKQSQEAMDALGISLTDSEGNMKSLATVMTETKGAFSKLSEEQKHNTHQCSLVKPE